METKFQPESGNEIQNLKAKSDSLKNMESILVSTAKPCIKSENRIANTKCSLLGFPWMMMVMQVENVSSFFFLIIMALQLHPKFQITSPYSSVLPWLIILLVNIVKEGADYTSRYKRDKEINEAKYKKLKGKDFISVESQQMKVGDIILIEKDQRVPADCILLKAEDHAGEVFIRTDQLDGETDWKRRNAPTETQQCSLTSLNSIEATIEKPTKDIYTFKSTLKISKFLARRDDNFIVFGRSPTPRQSASPVVIPTAPQNIESVPEAPATVVAVSNEQPTDKDVNSPPIAPESNSQATVAPELTNRIVIQEPTIKTLGCDVDNTLWANTVIASGGALALVIYTGQDTRSMMNTNKPRHKEGTFDKELDVFITIMATISIFCSFLFSYLRVGFSFSKPSQIVCVRYIIIFSYVIPISLKFMMATARFIYVYLLSQDSTLKTVKVLTNTLQEELARISFFLTDKTGTLTKNEMVMRKLHVGTVCYNAENKAEISKSVNGILEKVQASSKGYGFWKKSKSIDHKIFDLVEALSVCHSVIPVETEAGMLYQAASPDEVAMVNYSAEIGLTLLERNPSQLVIQDVKGNRIVYEIMHTFTFNSDTKRMGIILRKDKQYTFFVKGADTVMKSIVKENDWVEEEIDNMAREGLRTLVIGKKVLSTSEFEAFSKGFHAAKISMDDRNQLMLNQQCSLEKNLEVLGLTGVEDKLQDRVKQTLESLRNAGIKVWMLTGDKIETAISIAFSSRLLNKTDQYLIISKCVTKEDVDSQLNILETRAYNSLVIDGASIAIIIDHFLIRFIETAKNLHCLIGCRYTPTQKALMAFSLRKHCNEKVLCIGDGGNDVSMITQADVGVGIEGKEGSQASLAADFALKNFSDVAELMFHHGRRCYRNSSKMAHLIFHRGILISTIQAIFCGLIHFFPISILQGKMPALFILFTIIPLFTIIVDSDIPKGLAMQFPELFKELQINNPMSLRQFFICLTMSIFQASIFILLNFHFMKREMFSLSVISFTNLVINEQLMVLLSVFENINFRVILVCLGSLSCYILSIPLFSELKSYDEISRMGLILIGMNLIAIVPKLCLTIYNLYINPSSHIKLLRQKYL